MERQEQLKQIVDRACRNPILQDYFFDSFRYHLENPTLSEIKYGNINEVIPSEFFPGIDEDEFGTVVDIFLSNLRRTFPSLLFFVNWHTERIPVLTIMDNDRGGNVQRIMQTVSMINL